MTPRGVTLLVIPILGLLAVAMSAYAVSPFLPYDPQREREREISRRVAAREAAAAAQGNQGNASSYTGMLNQMLSGSTGSSSSGVRALLSGGVSGIGSLLGGGGSSGGSLPRCADMQNVDVTKGYMLDDRIVQKCIEKGWDPPVNWRRGKGRNPGIKVGGSGGFSLGARHKPDEPPGKMGGKLSAKSSAFNFSLSMPPWMGFPCQLPNGENICDGSSSGGGGTTPSCALSAASGDKFGLQQPLRGGMSLPLSCSGAVPLSSYQLTVNPSATHLFTTNAGSYNYWSYQLSGDSYQPTPPPMPGGIPLPANTVRLPTYLCRPAVGEAGEERIPLPPPMAQAISYNPATTAYIAIRLEAINPSYTYPPEPVSAATGATTTRSASASGPLSLPNLLTNPFDGFPPMYSQPHLVIPVTGGVPQVPEDCDDFDTYYRVPPVPEDAFILQSATIPGCEGSATECSGRATEPTSGGTCDYFTAHPGGPACNGKILIASLDRPNLIMPPGSKLTTTTISGRTAIMVDTADQSRLYSQYDSLMYFGRKGGPFVLPEGGQILLSDKNRLAINGPGTIDPAGGVVTLSNGGSIMSPGGTMLQYLPVGSTYRPAASLPWTVKLGRNLEIPAGYRLLTQPEPYARLPLSEK